MPDEHAGEFDEAVEPEKLARESEDAEPEAEGESGAAPANEPLAPKHASGKKTRPRLQRRRKAEHRAEHVKSGRVVVESLESTEVGAHRAQAVAELRRAREERLAAEAPAPNAPVSSEGHGVSLPVKNPDPAISVLVPIYNVERYLRQALDSLRVQTFKDFEVICINDGSTDASRQIVQEFLDADRRFRVIDKPNSGYGASMNQGIQEARGAYIAILEPDDFYEPRTLSTLATAAFSTNADVAKGDYWFYWSKPRERNTPAKVITGAMTGHVFRALDEPQIFFANPSIWSALYKRSFLLGNGIKLQETPGASFQDLGFTFKVMALAERIFCIDEPLVHYRQDNEQSSVNDPGKMFCVCDEFNMLEEFVAAPGREVFKPYLFRLRYDSYIWNFERLAPQLRAQFVDTMVRDFSRGVADGSYVPELFEQHQRDNLEFMLANPQKFLRLFPQKLTRSAKARYYLRIARLAKKQL